MSYRTSLSRLIARRLAGSHGRATWSRPVVQIATAGVAIGIALIVIATSIVHGFQSEVKELVVGFGSDIQVLNGDWKDQKIKRSEAVEETLRSLPQVRSVHPFFTSPGIVESKSGIEGGRPQGNERRNFWGDAGKVLGARHPSLGWWPRHGHFIAGAGQSAGIGAP